MEVSFATREKLKLIKKDFDRKSDVINWMLGKHLDQGDAHGVAGMEEEEADGSQKKRKLNDRNPLHSLELLSEREGMLYYLAGFERSEVDLIVKRFGEGRKVS